MTAPEPEGPGFVEKLRGFTRKSIDRVGKVFRK
jgi:hypothetical protein